MTDQNTNDVKNVPLEQLLKAPIRRKFLIFSLVAFSMFVTFVYLSVAENEYQIVAQVRPGITDYDKEGNEIRRLTPEAIRSLLLNEGYLACLASDPEYSKVELPLRIKAKVSPNSDLVTVSLVTERKEQGANLLGFIINCIRDDKHLLGSQISINRLSSSIRNIQLERQSLKIEEHKIDEQIKNLKGKIKSLNKAINEIREYDKVMNSLKTELNQKIKEFESGFQDTKKMMQGLSNGTEVDINRIMVSNMLQQELEYASRLQSELIKIDNQLRDDALKIHNTQIKIADLELSIKKLQVHKEKELKIRDQRLENEINILRAQLDALSPIEIVMEPAGLPEPLSPNYRLILAAVFSVSFLLGLLLAFYLEFFHTKSISNRLN